jgi:signal transduction histidine kinase
MFSRAVFLKHGANYAKLAQIELISGLVVFNTQKVHKIASQPAMTGKTPLPPVRFFDHYYALFSRKFSYLIDCSIPAEFSIDPEHARHARLVTRFGWLGAFFGAIYAIAYLFIRHRGGAGIIFVCSACFALAPFLLRWKKSVELAGNFLCLILLLGFSTLCAIEGGLEGHAIAWLVSVPLCALLLVGLKSARRWAIMSFVAAAILAGLDLEGIKMPVAYDPKWNPVVSATGYLGLILFMFILGVIFESSRAQAAAKMLYALQELAISNAQLKHLNQEKNEFLGMAAHDLKNPLTVVIGSAEMLSMVKDPALNAKLGSNIVQAAKRMRDLITNLLDANAIEQGKFMSQLVQCDLRALVEESIEHNLDSATRKQISLRVGLSDGLWAKADCAAVVQILDNLISNAVKYSPPNTTVHVHSMPEEGRVLVTVRDEGPGISEEDLKKMFQQYTRLTARPTGGESSTGLGLSIVKKLAEAISGSVQCHSQLGSGSTFTLRLPVWPNPVIPANTPPMPAVSAAPTPAGVKARVPSACARPLPRAHARN